MTNKHYQDAEFCNLSDFVPSGKFRTILPTQRTMPMGISEIAAEIHLKPATAKKLSFQAPWDGDIFGCLRDKAALKAALKTDRDILSFSLTDWDDKFLLVFDTPRQSDALAFYVTQQEVIDLLENCMRVPQQVDTKRT